MLLFLESEFIFIILLKLKTKQMLEIVYFNEDRYVWAKSLHLALELSEVHYSRDLKRWISTKYLFQNNKEYKEPVKNYDYFQSKDLVGKTGAKEPQSIGSLISDTVHSPLMASEHKGRGNFSENYLIRFELAKIITVNSNCKLKDRLVQWLLSIEADLESNQIITRKSLLGLMEMVKMCTYIDNQLDYYKQHKAKFFEGKLSEDRWNEFDNYRNSILKLLPESQLDAKYIELKKEAPKSSYTKIEKYAIVDALESIRSSLFDFLTQRFDPYGHKNILKARDLADFVKQVFESAGVTGFNFKPKNYNPSGQLNLFVPIDEIVDVRLIAQAVKELSR